MIHAYNKIYLDDAMHNLGEMFDYAQNACHIEPEIFWDMFIASGYADRFAIGMPAVVSGRSGTEIAMEIFSKQDASEAFPEPYNGVRKSKAYCVAVCLHIINDAQDVVFRIYTSELHTVT